MIEVPRLRPPLSIILVEDDDADAKAVRRAFGKVRIANPIIRLRDGVEALAFLRNETETPPPPSYVLMVDLNMPRMGGIEFLRTLRADPRLAPAVVFIMSTSNTDNDRRAAYDQNIAGYILKSNAGADFMQLVSTIEAFWRVVELPVLPTPQGAAR